MGQKRRGEIRSEMRRILTSLDRRWVQAASRQLCENLKRIVELDIRHPIRHILAWTPFFPGEADLSPFLQEQLSKREVYLPRISPDGAMVFVAIGAEALAHLQPGYLGIPEPPQDAIRYFDPSQAALSVVLVPGLAFDESGMRLGRGKGYYDRFFSMAGMEESEKIGIGWRLQIVSEIPAEPHDVRMDWVCHEQFGWPVRRGS